MINPSWSDFLIEVNEKTGFNPIGTGELDWYTDGFRTNEGNGAGMYGYGTRRESLASPLGNTRQYSREKCMPSRHAQ
jgi:hypothetical protein